MVPSSQGVTLGWYVAALRAYFSAYEGWCRKRSRVIRKDGVPGTPYWLRHTYAQNLLESGASIFEIKEMLGHDCIKATKRYLHIHIKLMREVLFDD